MRSVAIVLACLVFLTLIPAPTVATDQCTSGNTCTPVEIPGTPVQANKQTFYVYGKAATCPTASGCNGSPPANVIGLVWQETDCVKGLQTAIDITGCGSRTDTPVLF